MVKLLTLPDTGVVRAFRGSVDFYQWKGIAVARGWPKKPSGPRSPAVQAQQPWLPYANDLYTRLQYVSNLTYEVLARYTSLTLRDLFMTYLFGTQPKPFGFNLPPFPGSKPYPLPDPQPHYVAAIARRSISPAPTECLYQIRTNVNGPWHLFVSLGVDYHQWLTRSRRGLTFSRALYWRLRPPVWPQAMTQIDDCVYQLDLAPYISLYPLRWIYFTLLCYDSTNFYISDGFSPVLGMYIYEASSYHPPFTYDEGQPVSPGPQVWGQVYHPWWPLNFDNIYPYPERYRTAPHPPTHQRPTVSA